MKRLPRIHTTLICLLIFVTSASSAPPRSSSRAALDLVITGGRVYTLDPRSPLASVIGVRDRKIHFAGLPDFLSQLTDRETQYIRLENTAVCVPGLIDAHGHLLGLGEQLSTLDFTGVASLAHIRERVIQRIATQPAGEWIRGVNWDQNDWEDKRFPTIADIDDISPNHPTYLERIDGHAVWVNSVALRRCGITHETPDPPGGRVLRDSVGAPTGVLIDNAVDLLTPCLTQPSLAEKKERLRRAFALCNRFGLVGVTDAGLDSEAIVGLRELASEGELSLRVYGMLGLSDTQYVRNTLRNGPTREADDHLFFGALKLYADGALGSRGAALLAPYSDDSTNLGLEIQSREQLKYWADLALRNGFQVAVHAIGDRGVRNALNMFSELSQKYDLQELRSRVEHAQVIASEDIPRFATLNVIASVQPTHCTSDMYWAEERLGPERIKGAYAWRSLRSAGARLACGSDFPVESANPLLGMYAAVTRKDLKGWPDSGWRASESMSSEEALRGYTLDAAYAARVDSLTGSIAYGKFADVTIFDRDIFTCPPDELPSVKVLYTIVAGKVVYAASGQSLPSIESQKEK